MQDTCTFFRINATDDGGLFYLGMSSAGSTATLTDVTIETVFSGKGGGIFAVSGTTSVFIFTKVNIYDPQAKGGDGGTFWFFNTLTTDMTLTSCQIFNSYAFNHGGTIDVAGTTSTFTLNTCLI